VDSSDSFSKQVVYLTVYIFTVESLFKASSICSVLFTVEHSLRFFQSPRFLWFSLCRPLDCNHCQAQRITLANTRSLGLLIVNYEMGLEAQKSRMIFWISCYFCTQNGCTVKVCVSFISGKWLHTVKVTEAKFKCVLQS